MPIGGGVPTRHTYESDETVTLGWTPDARVLYATAHYATLPDPQLVTLDPASKLRTRVPLAQASEGTFDATGTKLFFVRPAFHRNVTRRYTGGTARRVWRFDRGALEATALTADYVLTSAHLHPHGESVVLTVRGRLFVVPTGDGPTVQASRKEGVRYRDVVFMPTGTGSSLTDSDGSGSEK